MIRRSILQRLVWASALFFVCQHSMAGIVITGTRVVYPQGQKEVSVRINNNGNQPALVQAWTDAGDIHASPTESRAPFVLSPPLFRLDPSKGQTLRLMFKGGALPTDKESVYYLNVLEIPPKSSSNGDSSILRMAFRSRIKIFYRPTGLTGKLLEAPEKVHWRLVPALDGKGFALQASNPGQYHVSQVGLTLVDGGKRYSAEDGMVGPGETRLFQLAGVTGKPSAATVEFDAIDDYGALRHVSTALDR